jgi:hypothetical protein
MSDHNVAGSGPTSADQGREDFQASDVSDSLGVPYKQRIISSQCWSNAAF